MRYDAIYTRQSVDRVDSISVESQAEICKREVLDREVHIYSDKGFSGKNTDRPEFQKLIRDVQDGKVGRVIVYRLDRISRSVMDFSRIIEMFQEYDVDFVSTMEKFDTATPIGKAMLMIVMVFAQLERETIQQRVTDAYHSRAKRGYFMGGPPPYGFALKKTVIDGIQTKEYVVNEDEMQTVRHLFKMFAMPHTTIGDLVRYLHEHGVVSRRGNPLCRGRVRDILLNPSYARCDASVYEFYENMGAQIINPKDQFIGTNGAYLYTGESNSARKNDSGGCVLILAPHEAPIDADVWLACREKLKKTERVAIPYTAKATWLAGRIKCAKCGYGLIAKAYHCKTKEDKRYFLCSHKYASHACDFGSLDADEVERVIFGRMVERLNEFGELSAKPTISQDVDIWRARMAECDEEIEGLLSKVPMASAQVMSYINERVAALDEEKRSLALKIDQARGETGTDVEQVRDYIERWDTLDNRERICVTGAMIDKVVAGDSGIDIYWKY